MSRRVAVVGSRDVPAHEVYATIDNLYAELRRVWGPNLVIVSGGARGVDQLAEAVAEATGIQIEVFPAEWRNGNGFDRAAGYKRNLRVVEAVDEVVAIWDGKSKGTKHTIDIAVAARKPVRILPASSEGGRP